MWFWLAMVVWVAVISWVAFHRDLDGWKRLLLYVVGIPMVALITGALASSGGDCPPDASDCDLAGLAGLFTAMFVAAVGFGAALFFAVVRVFLDAADRYQERHLG